MLSLINMNPGFEKNLADRQGYPGRLRFGLMQPVWDANAGYTMRAMRQSRRLRHNWPEQIPALLSCLLANPDGINAWQEISPVLRGVPVRF